MEHQSLPETAASGGGALIVVRPFGRFAAGDLIAQTSAMREVLRGENAGNVVPVRLPAALSMMSQEG